MRRVNVVNGIRQRFNDILGMAAINSGDINDWSIQAAMLSNFKRIMLAVNCNSAYGRRISGISASKNDNDSITITKGWAVTGAGDMVVFPGTADYNVSAVSVGETKYLCLLYSLEAMEDDAEGANQTAVANLSGTHQIVFDEIGSSGSADIESMISIENALPDSNSNKVMTAVLSKDSGGTLTVTNITPVLTALP